MKKAKEECPVCEESLDDPFDVSRGIHRECLEKSANDEVMKK